MADLTIEYMQAGRGRTIEATAKLDGQNVYTDRLNVVKASDREKFARAVASAAGVSEADVKAELLQIADELMNPPEQPGGGEEVDISAIRRPELFHQHDVSGLCVPVVQMADGKPTGKWRLYLRWHDDGRREVVDLAEWLDTPGGKLWFYPQPAPPVLTQRAGWSDVARREWLAGQSIPNGADVFRRLCEVIAKFLDFPPETASGTAATLALWILLSYIYPAWPSVPYVSLTGPAGSGKSTVFAVLARLCYRPIESSNLTASSMFRALHDRGGVLLLDEAERLRDSTPDMGEIRSILLAGYKRGATAMRNEPTGDGKFRQIEFQVYGPKALAAIGTLPTALLSRCIRITMFRADAYSDKPRRRLDADPTMWAGLRDDLHSLAVEHGRTWLELADRSDVCPADFGGRSYELWQPILALAWWVEQQGMAGLLELMQEHAAGVVSEMSDEAVSEIDEILLRIVADATFDGSIVYLKAKDILEKARIEDAILFKNWTPRGIGSALRRYGLRTRKGTGNTGRVYSDVTRFDLEKIARTYGFELGIPPLSDVPLCTASTADDPENRSFF